MKNSFVGGAERFAKIGIRKNKVLYGTSFLSPLPLLSPLLQAIESVGQAEDHKVIDLFVLFILYSIGSRRKAVEALFSRKIKAGLFSNHLLSDALEPPHAGVRD